MAGAGLTSAERDLSLDDPMRVVVLERAVNARYTMKQYAAGSELFERAIVLLEALDGPGSRPVLEASERYSDLLRATKNTDRAKLWNQRRTALR